MNLKVKPQKTGVTFSSFNLAIIGVLGKPITSKTAHRVNKV